uniref:Uncharacterized protein n=1 Tax=viral metagenome TaxID=1070528 RepID=A0A6C0EMM4_9ZZZZ
MVNSWTKVFYGYPITAISEEDLHKIGVEDNRFFNPGGRFEQECVQNALGYIVYKPITEMGYTGDGPTEPCESKVLRKSDRRRAEDLLVNLRKEFPSLKTVEKIRVIVATIIDM